jgi:pantoate--beta-alanine ligase
VTDPVVVSTVAELDQVLAGSTRPRAVVPTMGALHSGHAALVRAARESVGPDGTVVATVFVNPTQFGAGEDLDRYPRTLPDDVVLAGAAGCDVVFAPAATEVYGPAGRFRHDSVTIDPGPLGDVLEGAVRPGHFRGVLTVVAKLLALTGPDVAMFGEKDYQQLVLITRMAADLSLPTRIVPVATVREADGLALSSRNRYLSAAEREDALVLSRALRAVEAAVGEGAERALAAGREVLAEHPSVAVDYLVLTDPALGPAPEHGPARVLVAARVGTTRLIDNKAVLVP